MIAQKSSAWQTASVVGECSFPTQRVIVSERSATWRQAVTDRLNHICRLAVGWDGYVGRPVSFVSANFALNVLERVCDADTPAPSIIPGSSGDLQIEWHTKEWNLEIHIAAPYQVQAWRQSSMSLYEEILSLTNDFIEVRKWVGQLAEPIVATRPAAA